MKVLSFSYCFPNQDNPTWGIFVYQRLAGLAQQTELKVCSPVPWFPLVTGTASDANEQCWNAMSVFRPRFFYIPKFFKNSDGRLYASGLRRWLGSLQKSWQPDLLDAHFVWPDGVGVALLAQKLNIPYVITLRGKLYECLKDDSQTQQCRRALQGAQAVISVSSRMAEEAVRLGVDTQRLTVIPNGVDLKHFRIRDRQKCREKLHLPATGRLLVTVAHLGPRKGHHEVIEALAALPDDVRLIIVGGDAQGGSKEQLLEVAKKHGVEDRLILPGRQGYDLIPYFYSAADISVLASYREGCPNAVLESLACGTPVVATDVGAVADILPQPECGRMVPAQQVAPLKQALSQVLEKTWPPQQVRSASGVRSWDQVAEEVYKVFEKVLSPEC
ncbi:glycosyltransferase [Desulfuromonas acetoxidans]|uniref:glycosyltransferase n=1 Tax=Desulfuromonas acetoxidans TaxID=891 RepID=UPI00292D43E4|nr:glycosyltransferase [Desulfuromonas acetoxidans]